MPNNQEETQLEHLMETILEAIRDVKGEEITGIDLTHLNTTISRYFIICHGSSGTQARAMAESVTKSVQEKHGLKPWHREGFENAIWILLDYADVIIHIFQEPYRRFYNLEELWADGHRTDYPG